MIPLFSQGKGLDCKGVCNAPAAKTIFRMKMPTITDALAGKWPGGWVTSNGQSYEEMPIGRVFADAVLLPNGKVCARCQWWFVYQNINAISACLSSPEWGAHHSRYQLERCRLIECWWQQKAHCTTIHVCWCPLSHADRSRQRGPEGCAWWWHRWWWYCQGGSIHGPTVRP